MIIRKVAKVYFNVKKNVTRGPDGDCSVPSLRDMSLPPTNPTIQTRGVSNPCCKRCPTSDRPAILHRPCPCPAMIAPRSRKLPRAILSYFLPNPRAAPHSLTSTF